MVTQVVAIGVQELLDIINKERESAYSSGYIKAKKELEAVQVEPKFNELLKGVRELKKYLEYKGYWRGGMGTLYKVACQLVEEGDRSNYNLIFRCGCIDHAFATGFHFKPWEKKGNNH